MSVGEHIQKKAELFRSRYAALRDQVGRVIVGHDEVVADTFEGDGDDVGAERVRALGDGVLLDQPLRDERVEE